MVNAILRSMRGERRHRLKPDRSCIAGMPDSLLAGALRAVFHAGKGMPQSRPVLEETSSWT